MQKIKGRIIQLNQGIRGNDHVHFIYDDYAATTLERSAIMDQTNKADD
ncbi:MAG: hypothetical protein HRU08_03855 [Oleispira sp.]|nr:hypothetical protein [Oleispira sp.]